MKNLTILDALVLRADEMLLEPLSEEAHQIMVYIQREEDYPPGVKVLEIPGCVKIGDIYFGVTGTQIQYIALEHEIPDSMRETFLLLRQRN